MSEKITIRMVEIQKKINDRLLSLDFFRGLIMFILIAQFAGLYSPLLKAAATIEFERTIFSIIANQFRHARWEGLNFWDLIQPSFMFIVGVAMPLSFSNRIAKGDSYKQIAQHVIKRAFLLLLLGWSLVCIGRGEIVFNFGNVISLLSFTTILAFLVIRKSIKIQIGFSLLLILIGDGLNRFSPVEGFTNTFVDGENFGSWVSIIISGENGRVFTAIPLAAHTIWGVIAGQLIMDNYSAKKKLWVLFGAGIVGLIIGFGFSPFIPIIKQMATITFVFVSGGWIFIALALCYWIIDIKKYQKGVFFFAIVGMNPLFIYYFSHIGGAGLIRKIFRPFSNALFGWAGELWSQFILGIIVLFMLWYICYWMYKKKIFIRI